jgi:hypothetical protein
VFHIFCFFSSFCKPTFIPFEFKMKKVIKVDGDDTDKPSGKNYFSFTLRLFSACITIRSKFLLIYFRPKVLLLWSFVVTCSVETTEIFHWCTLWHLNNSMIDICVVFCDLELIYLSYHSESEWFGILCDIWRRLLDI